MTLLKDGSGVLLKPSPALMQLVGMSPDDHGPGTILTVAFVLLMVVGMAWALDRIGKRFPSLARFGLYLRT